MHIRLARKGQLCNLMVSLGPFGGGAIWNKKLP